MIYFKKSEYIGSDKKFSFRLKLGYLLFVLEKKHPVINYPVVGDLFSISIKTNTKYLNRSFFMGWGGVWNWEKIRNK